MPTPLAPVKTHVLRVSEVDTAETVTMHLRLPRATYKRLVAQAEEERRKRGALSTVSSVVRDTLERAFPAPRDAARAKALKPKRNGHAR